MSKNKIALVTGGSRGIGKDIALSLARKGTDIILTYRSQQSEAESVVAQIKSLGRKAAALPLNAADTASFGAFYQQFATLLKNTFDADQFDFLINAVFGGSTMPDTPEMRAFAAEIAALGRIAQPDDIGGIAAFLCSNDARWITGQRIEATGGVGL